MPREINWERASHDDRIDAAADNISDFVGAVLSTIDENAARASEAQWKIVCRFFAGCALAAQQQRGTEREGGQRIAEYFNSNFDFRSLSSGKEYDAFDQLENLRSGAGFSDGFDEFMDWLSKPDQFSPKALRGRLKGLS
jgi:hypothetical protein